MNIQSLLSIMAVLSSIVSASPLPLQTPIAANTPIAATPAVAVNTPVAANALIAANSPVSANTPIAANTPSSSGITPASNAASPAVTDTTLPPPTKVDPPLPGSTTVANSIALLWNIFDYPGTALDVESTFGSANVTKFAQYVGESFFAARPRGHRLVSKSGAMKIAFAAKYSELYVATDFDQDAFENLIQQFVERVAMYGANACATLRKGATRPQDGKPGFPVVQVEASVVQEPDGKTRGLCPWDISDNLVWQDWVDRN